MHRMSLARSIATILILPGLLVTGCPPKKKTTGTGSAAGTAAAKPGTAAAKPGTAAKPGSAASKPADTVLPAGATGALSEAAFKALHVHKKGEPPKLAGKMIELTLDEKKDGGAGKAAAYLSLPKDAKPGMPAVVVIHEWWGLNAHIKHWADRLAADGYAALAVDLYGGKVASKPDEAMKLMKGADPKHAIAAVRAAYRYLGEDAAIKASKRASLGWCFGGGWSLALAQAAPKLDAAVIYYGKVESDAKKLASVKAELLAVFANKDTWITPKVVDAFEAATKKAGLKAKVLRYDADHAFANPSGGRYDEKSAGAAWKEVRAFLARKLKGA